MTFVVEVDEIASSRAQPPFPPRRPFRPLRGTSRTALSQLAWAHLKAVEPAPAGVSLELTQDTAAWYTGTGARTTPVPVRTRSLAVALVGSARFAVAGR